MLMLRSFTIVLALLLLSIPLGATAAPWTPHLEAVASGTEAPPELQAHIDALKAQPPSPALTQALLSLLDAKGEATSRPVSARIAAIDLLHYAGDIAPVSPLLSVALGGRDGRLPKEPDIYEAAVEALLTYPNPALKAGLESTLAPHLLYIGNERLITNWAQAMLPHNSPLIDELRAKIAHNQDQSKSILAPILHKFDGHEAALIQQMRSAEGAILWRLSLASEALVLASWITDERPPIATLGARVAVGIGRERPGTLGVKPVLDALATLAQRDGEEWADARDLAKVAIPLIPLDSSHGGLVEGFFGVCPNFDGSLLGQVAEPTLTFGDGPTLPLTRQPGAWLALGVILLLLALWLGVRGRSRLWIFLATQGVALGLLVIAEGALGLRGGRSALEARPLFSFLDVNLQEAPPFKEVSLSGRPYYVSAQEWIRYQAFEVKVPEDGLRVALLGASSIHAPHYMTEETLTPRLQARLSKALPEREVEVINAALEGAVSYGILRSGISAMDAGANLLVIYYGHNEVNRFLSLAQYEGFDAKITALRVVLGRSALFSALLPLTSLPEGGGEVQSASPRMESPGEETLKDFRRLAVLQFTENIGRLLEIASARGVGVMMVTPTGNLACSFARTKFTGTQQDVVITRRAEALAQGGAPGEARDLLQLRCDQTLGGGEVHSEIINAHVSLAEDFDIPLLSGEDIIYGAESGLEVKDLFWDNLHPTPLAYDLLADALAEAIPPYLEARGD